jgi:hypothetical protein
MSIHFQFFNFQNFDIKIYFTGNDQNSSLTIEDKIKNIFNNINNCKEADNLTNILTCSEWDLKSDKFTPLRELIYLKIIDNIYEGHYIKGSKLNLTQEQTNLLEIFLTSFFSLKKLSFIAKPFKTSDNYLAFLWIEKLCSASDIMLTLTIDQIFKKSYVNQKHPLVFTDKTHLKAFSIIRTFFYNHLDSTLTAINTDQKFYVIGKNSTNNPSVKPTKTNMLKLAPKFNEIEVFKRHIQQWEYLHVDQIKMVFEEWNHLLRINDQPFQYQLKAAMLKNNIIFIQNLILNKIDILEQFINNYKNEVEILLPIKNEDVNPLIEKTVDDLFEAFQKKTSSSEGISQFENSFNEIIKSFTKSNNKINSKKNNIQKNIKKNLSDEQFIRTQEKVKKRFELLSKTLIHLDNYKKMVFGYAEITTKYLKSVILENQNIGDLADTQNWIDININEEWLKPSQKKELDNTPSKNKKKYKVIKNKGSSVDELQKELTVDELQQNIQPILSTENTIRELLLKRSLSLSKTDLSELDSNSLHVIHEMHYLIESLIQPLFNSKDSSDLENLIFKECQSHLFFLGCDLNLCIQALSKNDLESLSSIVPMLFLNIHTLFEQLMQREHLIEYGKIYTDSHRLTHLVKEIPMGKDLDSSVKELIKNIDVASLSTRYIKYYENRYSKESRESSKVLDLLVYFLNTAEQIQKGSLELDTTTVKELNEKVADLFEIIQTAYKSLFLYVEKNKGGTIGEKTIKAWEGLLEQAELAITKHINKHVGSTFEGKENSSLTLHEKSILKVLESIEQKIMNSPNEESSEFNNPIMHIEEAKQQIIRLLASIRMRHKYCSPIFTATVFRNYLGMQWIVEKLLQATCLFNKIPFQLTHHFPTLQKSLIDYKSITSNDCVSKKDETTLKTENERANYFNFNIGFNYPHLYTKELKWLEKWRDLIVLSQQYINEESELTRDEFDEDLLNKIEEDAIKVIIEQVKRVLEA